MRAKSLQDKRELTRRVAFFDEFPGLRQAHRALMQRVFATGVDTDGAGSEPRWVTFAFMASGDRCVAAVDSCRIDMVVGGSPRAVGAIARVAVDEEWRGLGLFRALMEAALDRCDAGAVAPVLLYTEDPALYRRFGFHPVPQHNFVGPAPSPSAPPTGAAIRVDPAETGRIAALLARRTPVSKRCAVRGGRDLFLAYLAQHDDLDLAYSGDLDALIVTGREADGLVMVDVVAPRIPSMAEILGALGVRPKWVRTLFPPDLLSWHGAPVPDDTGLMARGALPAAMRQSFMLPPTTEF